MKLILLRRKMLRPPGPLYDFSSFMFNNGGATGRFGPSLANLLSGYNTSTNPWLENPAFFDSDAGVQLWTVPEGATYRIEVWGAEGGEADRFGSWGRGARMRGDVYLTRGQVVSILVGQQGFGSSYSASGGGASAVWSGTDPLVIAGGGGGGRTDGTNAGSPDGRTSLNGADGAGNTYFDNRGAGYGGVDGNGGEGTLNRGHGGGGFFTAGYVIEGTIDDPDLPRAGDALLNGGVGGDYTRNGGFGGGGGARQESGSGLPGGGGGGGYSGGGGGRASGGHSAVGGGGGSINVGTNQFNSSGVRSGHGQVSITKLD